MVFILLNYIKTSDEAKLKWNGDVVAETSLLQVIKLCGW